VKRVAAVVLAAGAGRRFAAAGGVGHKLDACFKGRPVLSHVLSIAATAGLDPVIVVVAPGSTGLIELTSDNPSILTVINPDASVGMATSIVAGLIALATLTEDRGEPEPIEACVILLGDQPTIDPEVIATVMSASQRAGRPARAHYLEGPGHPVVLPRSSWKQVIAALPSSGDPERGARDVLTELGIIEVEIRGWMPRDIDLPEDLARIGETHEP
jgi:CTP:molybdopterin cytidylyltransferase MocA